MCRKTRDEIRIHFSKVKRNKQEKHQRIRQKEITRMRRNQRKII